MIQTSFNAISSGSTGMFARQVVIYVRYGRVIIAKAPRKRPGKGTAGQERTRNVFKLGADWSKKVRRTPALHAVYKQALYGALNVHNLAIADVLQAPVIHDICLRGKDIFIHATDNFKVDKIEVCIYSRDGLLLESGLAGSGEDNGEWLYTPAVKDLRGCNIVVTAKDLPGNTTVKQLMLEDAAFIQHSAGEGVCKTADQWTEKAEIARVYRE